MHDRRSSSQPWWGCKCGESYTFLSCLSYRAVCLPIAVLDNVDQGTKEQVYLSNGVT